MPVGQVATRENFLLRVEPGQIPVRPGLTPCWYWTGALLPIGYGVLGRAWGEQYAHRWSYKHYKGEIPVGHEIRHRCDERACVNPEHLETGTHAENIMDAVMRNESAFRRCVNNATAREIRKRRELGVSHKQLAEEYGISLRTVGRIVRGESKYIAFIDAVPSYS
jgi:hypothetical protein